MKVFLTCFMIIGSIYIAAADDALGTVFKRNNDCNYFLIKNGEKYTVVQHISGTEFRNWTTVYGAIGATGTTTIRNSKNETEMISVSLINQDKLTALKLFYDKCNIDTKKRFEN